MSTNGMDSWAVDLASVGAVYPFQGTEFILTIVCVIFWLGWHWLQFRQEATEIQHEMDADEKGDATRAQIDGY